MEPVGGTSALSPQTLFSVDNFIHYMTVSLEMLMNEVKRRRRRRRECGRRWGFTCSLCAPGSSYDCQRGPDPAHADSEGGPEAHSRLPAPEVIATAIPIIESKDYECPREASVMQHQAAQLTPLLALVLLSLSLYSGRSARA